MKKTLVILLAVSMLCLSVMGLAACQQDVLIVYTEAGFAPFEYISNNEIVGVDIEIMKKVGEKLGKKVVFENVEFDIIVDAVADGKLSNVGAAGLSITEARKEKVAFSNEYYTAKLYVIYKTSEASSYEATTTDDVTGIYWDKLAGKNIAIQNGTTADLFLGDELAEGGILYGTGAEKVLCSKYAMAIANIKSGDADVLIMDELPAKELIKNDSALKCAPLYYQGADGEADESAFDVYAICVTKGQDELLNAINEVLEELGEDGIQALVNEHLGLNQE